MNCPLVCVAVMAALATPVHAASLGDLAGRWQQSSSGQELVLQPRIKLQPSAVPNYGTSLGGSVGAGSMTNTTIVTEAVPGHVDRKMTLELAVDGRFTWTVFKTEPVDKTCTRTVRQDKRGVAKVVGGSLVLDITGGSESFEKSCGGGGRSALMPSRETYALTVAGKRMTLSGGSSRWVFARE